MNKAGIYRCVYLFVNQFCKVWTLISEKCNQVTVNVSTLLKVNFIHKLLWTLNTTK